MRWRKMDRIYVPDGSIPWAQTHAFPPTPVIRGDVIRLYLAFCDESTVGRVGFVDVLADDPATVVAVSERPLLDIGQPGAFDDNGVVPTRVLQVGDELWMYYVGFQLGTKLPYFQFLGLAKSLDNGETFERVQRVPIIDRSDAEMVNRCSGFVRYNGDKFQMWYSGGSDWTEVHGKPLPIYNIKYLESANGVHWPSEGRVAIDFASNDEHALGRSWVVEREDRLSMFFSSRTRSKDYRLGYAESFDDGLTWTRDDSQIDLDVSTDGWDAGMVGYASVVSYGDSTYMFYNGSDRGRTGFGYALLEEW